MPSLPARVLVVDDEPYITDLVRAALRLEGFEVEVASTGAEALAAGRRGGVDLVLLDVMLPDLEGVEVCRRWRADGVDVPVVFLTARDATEDRIAGLEAGGDDYLPKPFSLDELVARVRAVLRRSRPSDLVAEGILRFADLELDEDRHEARRAGEPLELTATEFRLLHCLLLHPRRVLSKAELLDWVWEDGFEGDPAIVETYISYLRKKVDRMDPPLIHTVRGVGYCLRLPPDAT
ncbi:response regulator transcription factor [Aciditerrimonas ferrireducens]|uniref:Response regulator transcription factor n=1 Tax=Aciditerrimonas ferrireducens TaxID=667306 RepID=A0ABV6C330_9ACTN|nr:response regulator transcription factor [Aciditerrimonas ferrireducens]MCK4177191.1 response regulator transcription factor [Aciditerrimonas ferrireducens]